MDVPRDFQAAAGVGLVARDAVRIDDGRAPLTLADLTAEFDGLSVCHPDRCTEAVREVCETVDFHGDVVTFNNGKATNFQ